MTTVGDPLVGADLGGYKLGRKLGQGGMGAVYFGIHHLLEKEAAVKLLPTQVAQNEQYRKRFFREAKAASKLEHPNIVSVLDAGIADQYGTCYLVMQFCGGQSLRDLIAKGPLDLPQALPVFYAMLDALIFAHDRGFIHRDVKPDNVLFALDGTPKLADFGLARDLESLSGLTASGQVLGTPNYMPLEQWDGHNLDARVDQYALGVLFYEALTCRRPVEAPTPTGMVAKLLKGDRTPITDWRTDLPPALIDAINKMMALQAEDRFGTLREAKRALIDSVAGVPDLPEPTMTPALPSPTELRSRDTKDLPSGLGAAVKDGGDPLGFGGTYVDTDRDIESGVASPSAVTRTDAFGSPSGLAGAGSGSRNAVAQSKPAQGSGAGRAANRAPGPRPSQPGARPHPSRPGAGPRPGGRPGPRPGAPITASSLGAPGTMHEIGEGSLADDHPSALVRAWRERPNQVLGGVIAGALLITVVVLVSVAMAGGGGGADANGNEGGNGITLNPPNYDDGNRPDPNNRPIPNNGHQHPGNNHPHPGNNNPQHPNNAGPPPFNPDALPVPTVPARTRHFDGARAHQFISERRADLSREVETVRSPLNAQTNAAAVGDFNGDGVPEIAIASDARPYRVAWYSFATENRSAQVLASAEGFDEIVQLASGDLDGDGDVDLVTLEDTGLAPPPGPPGSPSTKHIVRVVYNAHDSNARGPNAGNGSGRMARQSELTLDATPIAIAVGDVDDDGADDVIIAVAPGAGHPARVQIFKRGLVLTDQRGIAGMPYAVLCADVTDDKLADIVALARLGGEMGPDGPGGPGGPGGPKDLPGGRGLPRGEEDRVFTWVSERGEMADPIVGVTLPDSTDGTLVDLNDDGNLDLAIAMEAGGFTILYGNGRGEFDPQHRRLGTRFWALGVDVTGIAAADIDDNGEVDLLLATDDGELSLVLQHDEEFAETRVQLGTPSRRDAVVVVGEFDSIDGDDVLIVVDGSNALTRLSRFPTAQRIARDTLGSSGSAAITAMGIAGESGLLVTGHDDGSVSLWRMDEVGRTSLAGRRHVHEDEIATLVVTRDGFVGTGSLAGEVALWRIDSASSTSRTLELIEDLGHYDAAITAMAIVPSGRVVAFGTADDELIVWQQPRDRGPEQREPEAVGVESAITAIAIGPPIEGGGPPMPTILTGHADGRVHLWLAAREGPNRASSISHPAAITTLMIPPGEKYALSADASGTLKVLEVEAGARPTLAVGDTIETDFDSIARIHELPRGAALMIVDDEGFVAVWDSADDENGLEFDIGEHHDDVPFFTALTRDGQWLISVAEGGELEIWRVPIEYLN